MRTTKVCMCAAVALVCAAMVLPAQAAEPAAKEITIEEMFLRSVELQILREKAFSSDYETKMAALDELDNKIADGTIGNDTAQVEFVLEYLAMEGSGRTEREDGRHVNNFPEVRRRATNMLGRIGTEAARDALIRILLIDEEPAVRSESAYGLGAIGLNPNNETVTALAFVYEKQDPQRPDNNFAYAVILAFEKLASKNKGLNDPAAIKTLVKITQGNYLRTVKVKALQVLDDLKKGA